MPTPEQTTIPRVSHRAMWSNSYGIVCQCGWVAPMRISDTEQLKDHAEHKTKMRMERARAGSK